MENTFRLFQSSLVRIGVRKRRGSCVFRGCKRCCQFYGEGRRWRFPKTFTAKSRMFLTPSLLIFTIRCILRMIIITSQYLAAEMAKLELFHCSMVYNNCHKPDDSKSALWYDTHKLCAPELQDADGGGSFHLWLSITFGSFDVCGQLYCATILVTHHP